MGLKNNFKIQNEGVERVEGVEEEYSVKCGCSTFCNEFPRSIRLKYIRNKEVFFACKEGDIQTLNRIWTLEIEDFEQNVFVAANENHFNVVKFLFEQIPEKKYEDIKDKYYVFGWIDVAIVRCAIEGYYDILTFFIELGINVQDAFLLAARKGNIESVKILWSTGKITLISVMYALKNNAHSKDNELFNLLISYKTFKEKETSGPFTGTKKETLEVYFTECILNSCIQGHIDIFKYFMNLYQENGFSMSGIQDKIIRRISVSKNEDKVNFVKKVYDVKNIHVLNLFLIGACRSGQETLIKEYLKLGADAIDAALVACVIDGNIGNVLKFVELVGAKVTLRSVIYAAIKNYVKIFKFLLVKYKENYETSLQELYFKCYFSGEDKDSQDKDLTDISDMENWVLRPSVKDDNHEIKLAHEKSNFDFLIERTNLVHFPKKINKYEYYDIEYAEYNDVGLPEIISGKKIKKGTVKNIMHYAKEAGSQEIIDILKQEKPIYEPDDENTDPLS